jgi:hypothetical protein
MMSQYSPSRDHNSRAHVEEYLKCFDKHLSFDHVSWGIGLVYLIIFIKLWEEIQFKFKVQTLVNVRCLGVQTSNSEVILDVFTSVCHL